MADATTLKLTHRTTVLFTLEDFKLISDAARLKGLKPGQWVRAVALEAARKGQ